MFASRVPYLSKLVFKFSRRVECLDEDLDTPTRSPVPVLLKTNRSPSDEERQVQLEQSSLSSNPNWLDTFRDLAETESFIHKHECILSAFRTFPNEILILIFLACLPDVEHKPLYPRHEPLRPRKWHTIPSFRLSQVCKNWRDLVIHTPRMWTILGNVALEQRTTIPRKKHKSYLSHLDYFDFIKMLLKRSGDLDLWISISSTSPKSYTNSKAEYPVLALLIEHKDRWAALGIRASFQTVKAICNSEQAETYSRPFKRLRKLCLGITWGPYDSTIDISRRRS
ncbi:hypothetical protein CPB84DRAFT_1843686 [Gymnopilus junonius]|uniref:F-box domain-containing protein n=1 Tax=Gymnopilus junonius TaxID=109634 RepID=A0A9P5NWL1_GYMJU|nr:hypothetical protein CPB84DRAFT_1843686 [Gymnopilus junonius]